jgi:glycosyltransferase involved in cell wall biosynthesis
MWPGAEVAERRLAVLLAAEQLRRAVPGGIGVFARGLIGALARHPGDADVTLLASRAPSGPQVSADGGGDGADPLARFGRPVLASRLPGHLLTRAWDRGLVHAPAGYDVVHSVSLAAPALSRHDGGALVVTCHDLAWRRYPDATTRRGLRWHEGALQRARDRGAAFVVPSRLVAADLEADGVEARRITVIGGGADHLPSPDDTATVALLERLGVTGDFLLSVGTLEPRKNLERMVQAYDVATGALGVRPPLLIVGPEGWGRHPEQPSLPGGVALTGAVSDGELAGLYRRCRAFVYVPLTEGYGLPPLEAMRAGAPVVVSAEVPSVRDLGDEGPAPARLVDPLDVDDMARGMCDVLADDTLRSDLVARGRAFVTDRTWDAAARRHLELWRSLR